MNYLTHGDGTIRYPGGENQVIIPTHICAKMNSSPTTELAKTQNIL